MNVKIEESWKSLLRSEFEKSYFIDLANFVKSEYASSKIFPPGKMIFNAFNSCPVSKVKVVILGQDPYHRINQANGLCFSVYDSVKFPPSLLNIFKEIKNDIGKELPVSGNLQRWAEQGVLLLNATLTVRAGNPGSHQNKGWEEFSDAVIRLISMEKENLVFLLWGAFAQKKANIIDQTKHLILQSPHPSPFSAERGFFGNKHFSKTNDYLVKHNLTPIHW